ncbi:MAG: helix-turn-helix domain-containing protein [Defluviitaleaceae bacterium]|nr:helix-turn-helix domain-containing protein [Defluviitaleaceae bacterium]
MKLPSGVFGKAVKKARLEKNLTQEKLAELVNITHMHMKQVESERRNPSFEVLVKLVYALDLSLDSVFANSDIDETQEMKNKINLALSKCDKRELSIIYATIEAMLEEYAEKV